MSAAGFGPFVLDSIDTDDEQLRTILAEMSESGDSIFGTQAGLMGIDSDKTLFSLNFHKDLVNGNESSQLTSSSSNTNNLSMKSIDLMDSCFDFVASDVPSSSFDHFFNFDIADGNSTDKAGSQDVSILDAPPSNIDTFSNGKESVAQTLVSTTAL